ncbi:MAG: hypothetical protein ABI831_27045 [Betaproteobacteria bacterium]
MKTRVETAREIITFHLLDILTRHGVGFDPRIRTEGMEWFERALAQGAGLLLAGPHSMLSVLALRTLLSRGTEAAVISPEPVRIPGTALRARVIEPSFTYLLEVRRVLQENGIVAAMIDRDAVRGRSTFAVPTARGEVVVADALIHLAVRAEAPVVFFAARLRGGEFVIAHGGAEEGARSAEDVMAAFVRFLQEHVESALRSS